MPLPEGHTIHRLAAQHRRDLAGERVRVTSPQGRFALEASLLDGRVLLDSEARGKHLFYHWEGAPVLHVHLGLIGRFRTYRREIVPPTLQTRLAMSANGIAVYLSGPMVCRLIDQSDVDDITRGLGPDPLGDPAGGEEFTGRLRSRRRPVAAALLDQRVVAGIGNVYRAELLFVCGIAPDRPCTGISAAEADRLWTAAVGLLGHGKELGRIVTVTPSEVGAEKWSEVPDPLRLYVYGRSGEPCRRCATPIAETRLAGRKVWWCPSCQPW